MGAYDTGFQTNCMKNLVFDTKKPGPDGDPLASTPRLVKVEDFPIEHDWYVIQRKGRRLSPAAFAC
jgi:hypothetical protein